MTTPRLVLVPVAVMAFGLVAGCTAAPTEPAAGPTPVVLDSDGTSVEPAPDTTLDTTGVGAWCALVPSGLVGQTFGVAMRQPTASFTSDEILCRFLSVEDGGITVDVRFRPNQDHASFVAYRAVDENPDEPSLDLPGVGDEAFYRVSGFEGLTTHTVVARKGSVIVSIVAAGDLDETTTVVQAALAALS